MKRFVRCILLLVLMGMSMSGCGANGLLAPKKQFWGTFNFVSQYEKHVWLDGPTGTLFDKHDASPGWTWQDYIPGSQFYVLHWTNLDGTGEGSYRFEIDSAQDHNAHDAQGNAMDWYLELDNGGVSNFQP